MSRKRFKELKTMSVAELLARSRELELNLFDAKMKRAMKELKDTALSWRLRKELARVKTLIGQMQAQASKMMGEKSV